MKVLIRNFYRGFQEKGLHPSYPSYPVGWFLRKGARKRHVTMNGNGNRESHEKARMLLDGQYMASRLQGETLEPPGHWSAAQIQAFERVLANPEARDALLAGVLRGWQRLNAKAGILPE